MQRLIQCPLWRLFYHDAFIQKYLVSPKETFLLKCKLHKCTIAIRLNPHYKDLIILLWALSWLSPISSFPTSWLHQPGEMQLLSRYWWTPTSPGGTSSPYSSPSSWRCLFLLPLPSPPISTCYSSWALVAITINNLLVCPTNTPISPLDWADLAFLANYHPVNALALFST